MTSYKSIYFIRHGESTANAGGLSVESKKVALTTRGERQAQLLAENFDQTPAGVLVSEFKRAQQTAAPYCAKWDQTPIPEALLNEFETLSFELIDGLYGDQRSPLVKAYWEEAAPDKLTGPLAESFLDFAGRVKAFRIDVLPALPHQCVCFGHGMWFGMMLWQLMGFSYETPLAMKAFRRFQIGMPLPNAMVYELYGHDGHNWHIKFHGDLVMGILAQTEPDA
jgi:Fructose-2,6-bisphosphatase